MDRASGGREHDRSSRCSRPPLARSMSPAEGRRSPAPPSVFSVISVLTFSPPATTPRTTHYSSAWTAFRSSMMLAAVIVAPAPTSAVNDGGQPAGEVRLAQRVAQLAEMDRPRGGHARGERRIGPGEADQAEPRAQHVDTLPQFDDVNRPDHIATGGQPGIDEWHDRPGGVDRLPVSAGHGVRAAAAHVAHVRCLSDRTTQRVGASG